MSEPETFVNETHREPADGRAANVLSIIRSRRSSLASSEGKVANWLLQEPGRVIRLSMAQVAVACGVSDTTVLRFCRNMGFAGYTDLKLAVARDLASPSEIVFGEVSEADDMSTVAQKVFASNIQALRDTIELLSTESLDRAADMLEQAKRIFVYGVGTSGPIARMAENYFIRLGKTCKAQTDSYLQLMEAATLEPGDVVIGISHSGSSSDPVLTMRAARQNGAKIICITGNAQSPFTECADLILLSVSNETRAESISSRLAQISIIDTLYIILSVRDINKASHYEKRIWEAIMPKMI